MAIQLLTKFVLRSSNLTHELRGISSKSDSAINRVSKTQQEKTGQIVCCSENWEKKKILQLCERTKNKTAIQHDYVKQKQQRFGL